MMKRVWTLLLAAAMLLAVLTGCGGNTSGDVLTESTDGEIEGFRPVDCGMWALEKYELPFMGMDVVLSDGLLEKMDTREVVAFTDEDYTDELQIAYALMRFYATTQQQREQQVTSLDIQAFLEELDTIGAIGVYHRDQVGQLDELTGCDSHQLVGKSDDGIYEYYISTRTDADGALAQMVALSQVTLTQMHELDLSLGYNAFSTDRIDGLESVGEFVTEDIFGKNYTQEVFSEYDLTLVNVFATWCSPCVAEIPELEQVRQAYAEKGIRLGVVAVVLDAKNALGTDENAIEQAKVLYERSGAQFPFLIPDEGNMNGRLTGIESVPESFFVDSQGNIVSDPYIGANDQAGWEKIIDAELAKLGA